MLVRWITKTSKPNRPAIAKWSRLGIGRTTKGHTAANAPSPRPRNVEPYGVRVAFCIVLLFKLGNTLVHEQYGILRGA